MDVQRLIARDESVKPKSVHGRWCDDWVSISAHLVCHWPGVIFVHYLCECWDGRMFGSSCILVASVSIEVSHLRNDVMYLSDTWSCRLNSTSLCNIQCSHLKNTGTFSQLLFSYLTNLPVINFPSVVLFKQVAHSISWLVEGRETGESGLDSQTR
jgi:hypothetical protein